MAKSKYDPFKEMIVNYEFPSEKIAEIIGNGCTASAVRTARRRFLKPQECKKTNALWRNKNRTHENNTARSRCTKTQAFATNNRADYSDYENDLILNSSKTTRELAELLNRSVDAIYTQRHRLKKKLHH